MKWDSPPANAYYVMRHGQSKANVAGIIVSSIERDRGGDFGLTPLGRQQVRTAVAGAGLPAGTLVYASDFARARQTARLVQDGLGAVPLNTVPLEPVPPAPAPPTAAPALRERYFGALDGGPVSGYPQVWAADAADPERAPDGAEPAAAVLTRTAALVAELERRHAGQTILLVSHGDPLQILLAGRSGLGPARHREVPHLETAEIRRLDW